MHTTFFATTPLRRRSKKGLTIIEIIAALTVISVLAIVGSYTYSQTRVGASDEVDRTSLESLASGAHRANRGAGNTDHPDAAAIQAGTPAFTPDASAWTVTTDNASVGYGNVAVFENPTYVALAMVTKEGACAHAIADTAGTRSWLTNSSAACDGQATARQFAAQPDAPDHATTTTTTTTTIPYAAVGRDFNLTSMCRIDPTTGQLRIRSSAPGSWNWTLRRHGGGSPIIATGVSENPGPPGRIVDQFETVPWTSSWTTYKLFIGGYEKTKAIGANNICG